MKKSSIAAIILLLSLILLPVFTNAQASSYPCSKTEHFIPCFQLIVQSDHHEGRTTKQLSDLPVSLRTIEEGAFEGTAITAAVLPESLETIEDNAFANIPTLKTIKIPNATNYIGKDAFKGSSQVTITAAPRSYARAWAKENGIPFNPITSFYAYNKTIQVTGLSEARTELQNVLINEETAENQKTNPTGRMAGELSASRYAGCTAFHIQGRSPPVA